MVVPMESDKLPEDKTDDTKRQEKDDMNKINSLKSNDKHEIVAHYTKECESPPVERVKFEGLSDNDSIYSDESDEDKLPAIPDGGWGWVVVAAAFIVSACADGLAFSFGILHEEFARYFDSTEAKTSIIGSLFIAMPLLAGPIMSALVDRYGCRVMTMIAGVLSTVGFVLASISNSIGTVALTFGFISGLAMGILYVTAVVSVAFWFDKRRNLAVSLASCGIGVGTVVYSPLTKYLLTEFGWRHTVLLLAGSLLNMCVCGALMRNPEWLEIKQKRERRLSKTRSKKSSSAGSVGSRSIGGESVFLSQDEIKSLLQSGKSPDYILETLVTSIAEAEELEATTQMNAEQTYHRVHSVIHLPTFVQQHEKVPTEVLEKLMENKRLYNIIVKNYPDIMTRRRSETVNVDNPSSDAVIEAPKKPVEVQLKTTKSDVKENLGNTEESKSKEVKKEDKPKEPTKSDPNLKKTIDDKPKRPPQPKLPQTTSWVRQISMDHHYLRDMPLYRNTIMHRGAMMNIPRYKLRASSLPDMYKNSMWSFSSIEEMTWYDRVLETLKATFDYKMFTEFHFLMFNFATLIFSIWFIVPYFFLVSYMTQSEVEDGEDMYIVFGVASSIGIAALGWAGDQPWINVTKTYAICLVICGISVGAYPFFVKDYWATAIISAIFGVSFSSSYSYTPPILMQLMPLDYFTASYGLILLSQGLGHLVGPPIGGVLKDLTGTWDLTFYMAGAWLIVSGLCVGVIAYTNDTRLCGQGPLLKETDDEKKSQLDEAIDV